MKSKKNKNYLPLVEIESMVEQLREALLKADFPDADDICSAVEEIMKMLEDICGRWVTAHVMEGNKSRFIINLPVCEVSILLLVCFYCA